MDPDRIDVHMRTYGLREPADDQRLHPREIQVLEAASVGMNAKQTATHLGLSFWTVKTYRKTAQHRLRAKNTSHAVALALRAGYFT